MNWIRIALIAALIVAASNAPAQFTTLGAGGKGGSGGGGGGCIGAIDLSTGCAQPIAFGVLF